VTTASMGGLELVGFFAHRCPPCKEWVPRFVQAAETMPGGRDRTLAIVAGSDADAAADPAGLVSQLGAVATVVTEDLDGPVAQAFGVHGYPTMYRLAPDGTISAADPHEVVAAPVAR
jgi:hypothetical protein